MALATTVMAALVFTSAHPASAATTLQARPFALWPPSFCAKSAGIGARLGDLRYSIAAVTSSMKAGPDGACDDPSPAPAGTFAAMPRLQVYFEPSGGWVDCRTEDHLRVANPQGSWLIQSDHDVYGCGTPAHWLWAGARITYGGINHYDNRDTGAL